MELYAKDKNAAFDIASALINNSNVNTSFKGCFVVFDEVGNIQHFIYY